MEDTMLKNKMDQKNVGGLHELLIHVRLGNLQKVKNILEEDVGNINVTDYNLDTPLHRAASGSTPIHVELVKLLISKGAAVNAQNEQGKTPLHKASSSYCRTADLLSAEIKGTSINQANINNQDDAGVTPLQDANSERAFEPYRRLLMQLAGGQFLNTLDVAASTCRHTSVADVLNKYGVNRNVHRCEGPPPAHMRIYSEDGNLQIIDILLDSNANINTKDNEGKTALHEASSRGAAKVVEKLLVRWANVNIQDKYGNTAAHMTITKKLFKGKPEVVQDIQMASVLKILLVYCANVNLKNSASLTPLHLACFTDKINPQLIDLLLNSNADINSTDNTGMTPLHYASKGGATEVVERLLDRNADVNKQDCSGGTPAHRAVTQGHASVLKVLLNYGANIEQKNYKSLSLLHVACEKGDGNLPVIGLLLESGADIMNRDKEGMTPLHFASAAGAAKVVDRLLVGGADINAQNHCGNTPLHTISHTETTVTKVLIANGANINLQNNEGLTPLHNIFYQPRINLQAALTLLESNADIDIKCNRGDTALHLALFRRSNAYEKLLEKGARVDVKNNNGLTPYDAVCLFDNATEVNVIIKTTLEKHIVKLRTAGLKVDVFLKTNSDDLERMKAECVKELEKLKITKITESFCLNNVFLHLNDPGYLRNSDILQGLENVLLHVDFLKNFPLYGHFLRNTVEKSKRRLNLVELAFTSFNSSKRKQIWSTSLPDLVKLKILYYLRNDDLQNFIESG